MATSGRRTLYTHVLENGVARLCPTGSVLRITHIFGASTPALNTRQPTLLRYRRPQVPLKTVTSNGHSGVGTPASRTGQMLTPTFHPSYMGLDALCPRLSTSSYTCQKSHIGLTD